MASEELRKKHALLDWGYELKACRNRLENDESLSEDEKERLIARIAECKDWMRKIKSMA